MKLPERQSDALPRADLSIIIVNWNTRDLLARCLSSVVSGQSSAADNCQLTTETFVVDNASADGSAAMVRERFPWVRLIENTENGGFARANNQAIRQSTGRYVLLLNPDTVVHPGALTALVTFMDAYPRAGACGPRLLNGDGALQVSCHPFPTLGREFGRLFHLDALWPRARYDMARWDPATPRAVDVVQGACMMVRREALEQVGLLDEGYFIYTEEVDLCYRLHHADRPADHWPLMDTETNLSNSCHSWQIYWIPRAAVVHYGGQSTGQMPAEMFLRLYGSKVLYFRKHYGRWRARVYKLILLVAALARLALSPLAWLERSLRRQQHMALASHYRRLLMALPQM